jgi:hypothetical protein
MSVLAWSLSDSMEIVIPSSFQVTPWVRGRFFSSSSIVDYLESIRVAQLATFREIPLHSLNHLREEFL